MTGGVVVFMFAVTISGPGQAVVADDQTDTDPVDCGTSALYHMLHLEGQATDLVRLTSVLAAPGPDGHSLRELQEAARHYGLTLDPVVLPKQRSAINGSVLLFVKKNSKGHFVVVRPVGHTGRLIQCLDGDRVPVVFDADWLFASPSWTGIALVPHKPKPLVIAATGVFLVCIISLAYLRWGRRRDDGSRAFTPPMARPDDPRRITG